jgi:hypothetical protein
MPAITDDISFQKISSPLGTATPDGALCNRDKIMAGFVKKINPSFERIDWADTVITQCEDTYPGMGGFGPGGGPLS